MSTELEKKRNAIIAKAMGRAIRHYREKKELSQNDMINATGLERTVFWRYDTGKTSPGIPNLIKIAEALDMNPADIVKEAYTYLQEGSKEHTK